MYFRFALLFLTLFAAVVTSQENTQACTDAELALAVNQPCLSAFTNVSQSIETNTTISIEELTDYCSPECRTLTRQVLAACTESNSPLANLDINPFVCTIDGDVSCFDFIRSSQFTAVLDAFEASRNVVCDSISDGQTCSPECETKIQDFVNAGGCCLVETLQFAGQIIADADFFDTVSSTCPFVNLPEGSCGVIGEGNNGDHNNGGNNGGNGLVISGNVLLIAAIIVTVLNR